jgi:iron(III) transport system ATP-binding protein
MMGNGETALSIRDLRKTFHGKDEKVAALDGVGLEVREGELFTLLGPSGCGKTTTLRCIAGFEKPTSGQILFKGRDFTSIPPFRRNIGMVFQSYALFPHLSIAENVAYGLRVRHFDKQVIDAKVADILRLVGLGSVGRRKPGELSGGQQQRIALARALIYGPELLLLDEPLSNLDAKLRVYMREEIRRIQQEAGVTTIYVTHDQEEALSISDRIAVMHAGRVSQIGGPDEIYDEPSSVRVADFIGRANFLPCRFDGGKSSLIFPSGETLACPEGWQCCRDFDGGEEAILFVRPERMELCEAGPGRTGLRGRIRTILYMGAQVRYSLELFSSSESAVPVMADCPRRLQGASEGDTLSIGFRWDSARLFPAGQKDQMRRE